MIRNATLVVVVVFQTLSASAAAEPIVELSAEQDHRRMMQLLGIGTLRPGANYFADPKSANNANYDESKANPYPELPPPLLQLEDGTPVTSSRLWSSRRAEIK